MKEIRVKVQIEDIDKLIELPNYEIYPQYFNRYGIEKYNPIEWGRLKLSTVTIIFEIERRKMMKVPNEICSFKAGCNTSGQIWIEKIVCNVCNQKKECICIDSSDGEYGEGAICFECIKEEKNKYMQKQKIKK